MLYRDGKPVKVETIVVSQQHTPDMKAGELEKLVRRVVKNVIPDKFLKGGYALHVNPTGRFVIGGPSGDTGLTGRKIIVDTYGGVGSHGGGAFSGKDPTKVDRSAAYMCRYIAKNIVAAGLAEKCEVQVSYGIGMAEPLSVNATTYETGKISDVDLAKVVRSVFDMTPAGILSTLKLRTPKDWCYRDTAAYGPFGHSGFPWEETNKVKALQRAAKPFLKKA